MPEDATMPASTPYDDMIDLWSGHGKLRLQRCEGCGKQSFFPRTRCSNCWSDELVAVHSNGAGHVQSFSLVHKGLPDDLQEQAPIVIAEIRLDEGATLIARVVMAESGAIRTGMRVVLLDAQADRIFQLPTFKRCQETNNRP